MYTSDQYADSVPSSTALLICCFNDGNSFFQVSRFVWLNLVPDYQNWKVLLCGVMWGYNRSIRAGHCNCFFLTKLIFRFQRPPWTTGSLIPLSFLCGIASAILIWRGGQKTKRTKEIREKLRRVLMMKHPHFGQDLPIDIAYVPTNVQDPVGASEKANDTPDRANGEMDPGKLDPEIEARTQIHECMTIPRLEA